MTQIVNFLFYFFFFFNFFLLLFKVFRFFMGFNILFVSTSIATELISNTFSFVLFFFFFFLLFSMNKFKMCINCYSVIHSFTHSLIHSTNIENSKKKRVKSRKHIKLNNMRFKAFKIKLKMIIEMPYRIHKEGNLFCLFCH